MELLAVSILLSMVLYLVDKNQQWGKFWKALIALVVLGVCLGSFLYFKQAPTPAKFDPNAPYEPAK